MNVMASKNTASKKITLKQTGSGYGRVKDQQKSLYGLGLGKIGRVVSLEDTPSVRGMVNKVRHLLDIVSESK